ncbi:hypothetical protein J2X31_003716 [Flavobacterium arsenatis]|uniref:YD repeat-containing protein n=2 Tax=Flavobacterium arsenatis TaxID=1484332 RepID=A0ABU1TUX3_9FLAO|nr:hypothetical protein [Flavobacterium arsenatis]
MNIRTRIYSIAIFTALASSQLMAQQLPNVIPPSPEATSLAKFVDMPVSHYNGLPNISIPIYTIDAGSVQVPISLSYHAKGIQVAEIASRVGTGWALNAGGLITRQARDMPDDHHSGRGYLAKKFTSDFFTNPATRALVHSMSSQAGSSKQDLEPDLFMFNFMGFSGKFIFDHVTKKPVLQKADDIKIEPVFEIPGTFSKITSWLVTDQQGIKYTFTAKDAAYDIQKYIFTHVTGGGLLLDNSIGAQEALSSAKEINAWYLTSIETPQKDVVGFTYNWELVNYYTKDADEFGGIPKTLFSYNEMYQHQLSSISFRGGKVYFTPDTVERQDLNNGYPLKHIRVENSQGLTIKSFTLEYFYTTASPNNDVLFYLDFIDAHAKKRLFLDKIAETDSSIPKKTLVHDFNYNPLPLPNRHSVSIDNWGYFNGIGGAQYVSNVLRPYGRIVHTDKVEAGMLKEIIYPTGGYSRFEYEQNKVAPPDFMDEIAITHNNPMSPQSFGMVNDGPPVVNDSYTDSFTIDGTANVILDVWVQFPDTDCPPGIVSSGCIYKIFILNSSGQQILHSLPLGRYSFSMAPGTYMVKVTPKGAIASPFDWQYKSYFVSLKWRLSTDPEELLAGGKRIKKITKGEGSIVHLKKEFFYEENGISTGKVFSIPNYYQKFRVGMLATSNMSTSPMSSVNNGALGYSKITEIDSQNNGKTVYTFTNFKDTGTFYRWPYHTPNDMEWTRGLPLETEIFSSTGTNQYRLEKKVKNKYVYYNNSNSPISDPLVLENPDPLDEPYAEYLASFKKYRIPIIKSGHYALLANGFPIVSTPTPDTYRLAYFYAGRLNLSESIVYDYFYDGSSTVNIAERKSIFTHDSPVHHQMTKKSDNLSDGSVVETRYNYAKDAGMAGEPQRTDLVEANRLLPPLSTSVFSGLGEKLSETKTLYKDWDPGAGLHLSPEVIKTSKGGAETEPRVKYNALDITTGNPLEVEQAGGTKISYIWGYNKTQPIAKIENATNAEIKTALGVTDLTLVNETDLTAINSLRVSLPDAMVTTYTYKPLVGITSITDPKGDKITYHYDSFNRLQFVKDKDGNILSENQYRYRTQN